MHQIAKAVGLSQNGILHHVASKDALFVEVLRRRDELARLEPEGSARSGPLTVDEVDDPGFAGES